MVCGCGVCLRCAWPEREAARKRADQIICCIYMYMCRLARKRADLIIFWI